MTDDFSDHSVLELKKRAPSRGLGPGGSVRLRIDCECAGAAQSVNPISLNVEDSLGPSNLATSCPETRFRPSCLAPADITPLQKVASIGRWKSCTKFRPSLNVKNFKVSLRRSKLRARTWSCLHEFAPSLPSRGPGHQSTRVVHPSFGTAVVAGTSIRPASKVCLLWSPASVLHFFHGFHPAHMALNSPRAPVTSAMAAGTEDCPVRHL